MNWTQIEGNWKQFKGKVKEKWGGPEAVAWFAHNGGDYFFAEYLPAAWGKQK